MRKITATLLMVLALATPASAQFLGKPFPVVPAPAPSALPPNGSASGDLGGTYPAPTVTNGSHITNASVPNSGLVNPATTVNGQTCTLGSTCTITTSGVTSVTCNGVAITTTGTCSTIGQVPGTTTNDTASAGNVGQSIGANVNRGSFVSLTSGTTGNITSVSLTAGDWNVNYVGCGNVTAATSLEVGVTSTSATLPSTSNVPSNGQAVLWADGSQTGDLCFSGMTTFQLAGTTTIYLAANMNGTGPVGYGSINARRAR